MEYILLIALAIVGYEKLKRTSRDLDQVRRELAKLREIVLDLTIGGERPAGAKTAEPAGGTEMATPRPAVAGVATPPEYHAAEVAAFAERQVEPEASLPTAAPVETTQPVAALHAQEYEAEEPPPQAAAPEETATAVARVPREPAQPPAWVEAAKRWLFTGNLVAKFGLLILFIGVGFLLKYAAETYTIPIELRLAAVVAADLGMLGWAWRIRDRRRDISLPTQGVAIAILMLVVFGAYQRYGLIPASLAFGLLIVLTAFTCALALLQDAIWLASFGIAGGFAGPVLLSTGQGNAMGLFSYYALLNAGIFGIAFKRAWRMLNLLGFAFTFIVGTAWGVLKYAPDDYVTAQAFLILFFLFYVGIGIAYTGKHAAKPYRYVDVTLVLGTPLLAFGLQYGLVKDMAYAMAMSALAMGAFYLVLAQVLWRRSVDGWRPLVDAFLALGVVFGSLAIPLALDNRWTSGAWALEGCGFVWFGLRQKQTRTWVFGLLLQFGAWLYFIGAFAGLNPQEALNANLWLGFLLLAASAFGIATNFRRESSNAASRTFDFAADGFLALAGFWLLAGMWAETILRVHGMTLANLLVAGAIVTAILLNLIGWRMQWRQARKLALVAQLAGAIALIVVAQENLSALGMAKEMPLPGTLMIAAAALFTSRSMQRRLTEELDKKISAAMLLWAAFWWFGPSVSGIASHLAPLLPQAWGPMDVLWATVREVLAAGSAIVFVLVARRIDWAGLRWFAIPAWIALAWRTVALLATLYLDGSMPPAPYWVSFVLLWCASEVLLQRWQAYGWKMKTLAMQVVHLLRTAGPWLAIWPAGAILVSDWLYGPIAANQMLAQAGWSISGSWSRYLPAWAMMLVIVWLISRSRSERWPTKPVSSWYRRMVIPCASAWALLLVVAWNLLQNGAMEPLPYLPLLNPLDLTTGIAAGLAVATWRMLVAEAGQSEEAARVLRLLPRAGAVVAYVWFNLMLLRTAAHYLGIAYLFDQLMGSLFVQAMLSLAWSVTALVLMRRATVHARRTLWLTGALLLAVVVAKLFLVDLSNSGSIERIVSFVGVGALMLTIGYLAPYPKASDNTKSPAPVPNEC